MRNLQARLLWIGDFLVRVGRDGWAREEGLGFMSVWRKRAECSSTQALNRLIDRRGSAVP